MDALLDEVSLDEFKLFYGLDRDLYTILVRDLSRDPTECMQIMGLWLWFERGGICNVISKILSLDPLSIDALADEAVLCLKLLNHEPLPSQSSAIPLTHSLVRTEISLKYFYENRHTVFHEVQSLVSDVYIPALSDIMEKARQGGFDEGPAQNEMAGHADSDPPSNQMGAPLEEALMQSFSVLSIERDASPPPPPARAPPNERSMFARTMFATFSKGYPVTESEVRQFFTRMLGNCIDSLHMQEVGPDKQALYARIVFIRQSFIRSILNGETKAKFTINGKHVWIRQFVPRNGRLLPCGCPSVGPSSACPHHP